MLESSGAIVERTDEGAAPAGLATYSRTSLETGSPEIEALEQAGDVGDAVDDAFELAVHLDAGRLELGLVLVVALRGVQQRLVPGDAEHGVAVARLILLRLCLADEKIAAERVEGDRQPSRPSR